jgi:hypothetical protein
MKSKKKAIKVLLVATMVSAIAFNVLAAVLGQGNCSRTSSGGCSVESAGCSSSSPSSSGSDENGSWSLPSFYTSGQCRDSDPYLDNGTCNCH